MSEILAIQYYGKYFSLCQLCYLGLRTHVLHVMSFSPSSLHTWYPTKFAEIFPSLCFICRNPQTLEYGSIIYKKKQYFPIETENFQNVSHELSHLHVLFISIHRKETSVGL